MFPKFTLSRLLAIVALLGAALAIATQTGIGTADFELLENKLVLNDNNLVEGQLLLGYKDTEYDNNEPWPVEFNFRNVVDTELLTLKKGAKATVRFRASALGSILKKQSPFEIYVVRALGIPKEKIVGYVSTRESTKIIVDGNQ